MKKISMFLVISLLPFLASCSSNQANLAKETEKSGQAFLTTISTNELKKKIKKKETGFIYIGRPTCPDCQAFQPILKKELAKRRIPKIFYYNTDKANKKSQPDLKTTLQEMEVNSVPTMVYLNNGKVVSLFSGTREEDKLTNWFNKFIKK